MRSQTYTTIGTLSDERTLRLDKPVPLPAGRVRITIEQLSSAPMGEDFLTRLRAIHATLRQAGHQSPTGEEVVERIQRERESWEQ
jgi:hypothetical protein